MHDKDLYTLAVLNYKKLHQGLNYDELFPVDWGTGNYHLKIEIIAEAITKKILIKDTDLYKERFLNNNCFDNFGNKKHFK